MTDTIVTSSISIATKTVQDKAAARGHKITPDQVSLLFEERCDALEATVAGALTTAVDDFVEQNLGWVLAQAASDSKRKFATASPTERPNDLLTVTQAANLLDLQRPWVMRQCKLGHLKATQVGTQWVTKRRDVESFAQTSRAGEARLMYPKTYIDLNPNDIPY